MHLADDRVARHAAQAARNLTRTQAFGPEFLKQFNPLVSPSHGLASSNWTRNPPVCLETAFENSELLLGLTARARRSTHDIL